MQMIQQPTCLRDLVKDFSDFSAFLNSILASLDQLQKNDPRRIAITECRAFFYGSVLIPFRLGYQCESFTSNAPVVAELLGIEDSPGKCKEQQLQEMLGHTISRARSLFVTASQFALESALVRQLTAMGQAPSRGGFERLLLAAFPGDRHKCETLLIPAKIRNALHSNGVHSKPSWSYTVNNEVYRFIQGKEVHCASFRHILHVYYEALPIYRDFFLTWQGTV